MNIDELIKFARLSENMRLQQIYTKQKKGEKLSIKDKKDLVLILSGPNAYQAYIEQESTEEDEQPAQPDSSQKMVDRKADVIYPTFRDSSVLNPDVTEIDGDSLS